MKISPRSQKKDEQVTAGLRALFESHGFTQARVNKFEEYQLYIENKNFLDSEQIITFMDMDGRLMALKPDATLSIVKNMPARELHRFEKLFYVDEVCRASRDTREYKMRSQAGVELIGPQDPFANLEILDLALESLSLISPDHVLDLSHQGFVLGLLELAETGYGVRERLLEALHTKSPHNVAAVLADAGINGELKQRFLGLAELSGSILEALPGARELVLSDAMENAWQELDSLGSLLRKSGLADRVSMDFSVVNDLDYYNGLIFTGYVKGVPDAVLTGGRYDSLMRRMGKRSGAIGFAVSLSELNTYFKNDSAYDFDVLLTYEPDCDQAALLAASRELRDTGKSVRLERMGSDTRCICRERYHFDGNGLRKEGEVC